MLRGGCNPDLLLSWNTMYILHFPTRVFSFCERIHLIFLHFRLFSCCFLLSNGVVHIHAFPPTRVIPLHISFWKFHGCNFLWDVFWNWEMKNVKMFMSRFLQKKKKKEKQTTSEINMVVLRWFCLDSLAALCCRVSCKSGSAQQLESSPLSPSVL